MRHCEHQISNNHFFIACFGLKMEGDWNVNNTPNPKVTDEYNGKEWVDDLDLNMNDYGARWYDPATARWSSVDPLAEKYYGHSGYNYVLGNPVNNVDPDGRWVIRANNGRIRLIKEKGDNFKTLVDYFKGSRLSERSFHALLESYINAKAGVWITLPEDNFSRALTYSDINKEKFGKFDDSDVFEKPHTYNCVHHCIFGASGREIYDIENNKKLDFQPDTFIKTLDIAGFKETSGDNLVYGQTLFVFEAELNQGNDGFFQHVAVYAGKDRKGNIRIHTKNNSQITPQIISLTEYFKQAGRNTLKIRYFNPKNKNGG